MSRSGRAEHQPDPVEAALATLANLAREVVAEKGWGTISITIRNGEADQVRIDRTMRVVDIVKAA